MGRGRQKAKATRQAREIKYYTPPTDLNALQNELAGQSRTSSYDPAEGSEDYSEYVDKYADDFEEEDDDAARR